MGLPSAFSARQKGVPPPPHNAPAHSTMAISCLVKQKGGPTPAVAPLPTPGSRASCPQDGKPPQEISARAHTGPDSRRRDCHSADIPSPSLLGRGEAVNRSGKQCIHKRQRKSSARQRQAANGSEITQGTAVKRSERQQNDRPADGQAPTAVVLRRRAHQGPSRPAGTPTSTCLGVPHHITDYHGLSTKRPESPRIAMQRASMSIKWP